MGINIRKNRNALKLAYPSEPWKWNPDWSTSRIAMPLPYKLLRYWGSGIFLLAFSYPLFKYALLDIIEGGPLFYIFFLFPVFGLLSLIVAIIKTFPWLKNKATFCDLITYPGAIGSEFKAVVWANYKHHEYDSVHVTLTNYHHWYNPKGKNGAFIKDVLWQHTYTVNASGIGRTNTGKTTIPIVIPIPRSCSETNLENRNDCIKWELEVSSKTPGINFKSKFEIPVVDVEEPIVETPLYIPPGFLPDSQDTGSEVNDYESTQTTSSTVPSRPLRKPKPPEEEPWYTSSIVVRETSNSLILDSPANRSPQVSWMMTWILLGLLVFLGFNLTMMFIDFSPGPYDDAPPWVLGVISTTMFIMIAAFIVTILWFKNTTITFQNDQIVIVDRIFGIESTETINFNDIRDTEIELDLSSNNSNSGYYKIVLYGKGTSSRRLIGLIPRKKEAEDLEARIRKAVGMDQG